MITVSFLLTALIVVLIPGTGVIYTVAIGVGRGRRASLWAALGCTLGIVPALMAAALGLAAVMHTSALAYQAVRWAGVAYLVYLAWQALRADGALCIDPDARAEAGWRTALRGILINALNPKLSIFFLALLPPFLSGNPATATSEMLELGAVFMVLTFVVFALYGAMAALARDRVLSSRRALRWLSRGIAVLFVGLAGKLAVGRA